MVVSNGQLLSGKTVNFQVMVRNRDTRRRESVTDSTGIASTQVNIDRIDSNVIVSACVAPGNVPCRNFTIHSVVGANLQLSKIAGDAQID